LKEFPSMLFAVSKSEDAREVLKKAHKVGGAWQFLELGDIFFNYMLYLILYNPPVKLSIWTP
jgi:hypothetical protein